MEILNNIWNAISMPNELLITITTIPLFLVENLLMLLLFTSILNITSSMKQKILYVSIMSIVSILSMFVIPNPFNIFFNYLMTIMLVYLIFKSSFLKSTVSIILSGLIFNIISNLILNPYITVLNISSEQLSTIFIYRLPYIMLMYSIVSIIIVSIKNRNFKINFIDEVDTKTKIIIHVNLIIGIITIILQTLINVYYIDKLPIVITFLSFLALIAYFITSLYSLTRIFKLILTTQKLQSAEEYNNSLRILHDSVRGFKHDFDNIVTTIGGYIRTGDMEGLKKYYLQLEDDCQKVNNLYILNPEIVNNGGIYNLLTKKYHEADSKGIKINITFLLDLSKLNMKIYEFARILGVLLDNAIDASSECDEKIISIIFREDYKNNRQLIIIENTFNDKEVDINKIFEKGISGKENHTGLGLWEVRKVIKKYSNVNLYTTKDDKFFKQQLEIYF